MSDYSTWKVADLKAELKRRGIPQTGLRVKQNFIDRLLEDDNEEKSGAAAAIDAAPDDVALAGKGAEDAAEAEESKPTETIAEEESQESPDQKADGEKGLGEVEGGAADTADVAPEQVKSKPETASEHAVESKAEITTEQTVGAKAEGAIDQTSERESETRNIPTAEAVEQAPDTAVGPESTPAGPDVKGNGEVEAEAPPQEATAPGQTSGDVAPEQPPEQATAPGTESPTPVPVEETIEDARKRKRRSVTPAPTPEDIAKKRLRSMEESPRRTWPEDERGASISEGLRGKKARDARFKGLFAAPEPDPIRPASPSGDAAMDATEVEPALHVATAALYIDGLMRPLQPASLRNHLVNLASHPGDSPNPDVILDYYLDPVKTHCFVSFANVSAASRVRSALQGTVWPNERNRKTLFVDFIPEDKLQEWVRVEEDSQRRGGRAPRWEVRYDSTDGGVEAVLREVDPTASAQRTREPITTRPPPLGPRASFADRDRRPIAPQGADNGSRPGQGFKALDELFRSTTTKPKLYYLPVPRDVVDRRLDRFDDLIRKGSYPRRGGDDMRRITFEDTDVFVDNGPEFGGRNRGRRRGRGMGSEFRGRRGGFGDSWRRDRN
ncbi:hypothetical protein MPDQ_000690 [Monascus purpureus]|uniref:SAP domain-containing protein n=1 Tax=Monascus purpureus TaxID=5098 RepID=A0A507QRH9_MONPU|nr:hypothetical protein MPDQ_000690 [Monascus purpureus]BDD62115.1 hypothetical protein MAP00_007107 [Monascus purpureus]